MKIINTGPDKPSIPGAAGHGPRAETPVGNSRAADAGVRAQKDHLELSAAAQAALGTDGTSDAVSHIRLEKIKRIKGRIADGSYTVDSGKIASEMIRDAVLDLEVRRALEKP